MVQLAADNAGTTSEADDTNEAKAQLAYADYQIAFVLHQMGEALKEAMAELERALEVLQEQIGDG